MPLYISLECSIDTSKSLSPMISPSSPTPTFPPRMLPILMNLWSVLSQVFLPYAKHGFRIKLQIHNLWELKCSSGSQATFLTSFTDRHFPEAKKTNATMTIWSVWGHIGNKSKYLQPSPPTYILNFSMKPSSHHPSPGCPVAINTCLLISLPQMYSFLSYLHFNKWKLHPSSGSGPKSRNFGISHYCSLKAHAWHLRKFQWPCFWSIAVYFPSQPLIPP